MMHKKAKCFIIIIILNKNLYYKFLYYKNYDLPCKGLTFFTYLKYTLGNLVGSLADILRWLG